MGQRAADVALLTEPRYAADRAEPGDWYMDNILQDDRRLRDALGRLGLTAERVPWSQPDVDWSIFRVAVFRTTWDYFDRIADFHAWLDRIESQTQLVNPAPIVRWSLDKHYLADLDRNNVPIVPTRYLERGSTEPLGQLLDESGWDDAVLKPCVGATARETYRLNKARIAELEPRIQRLLESESLMLQPFQRTIMETGEDALMFIDGRYSHAVRKVPKAGDFRVQDDYGGTVREYTPTPEQIEVAERAIAVAGQPLAYGRVDLVQANDGRPAVMELELIEPELWLRLQPRAAESLARAISERI